MTTGHDSNNLYSFDDPLGNFQFQSSSGFNLSCWQTTGDYFDSDSDESDGEADMFAATKPAPRDKNTSSITIPLAAASVRESTSSCSGINCLRSIRVRFCEQPEVRSYQGVDRADYGILFYSCHELQRMIDDAKREKDDKAV